MTNNLTYLEDFKSSNIQDSNKGCTLTLGPIQRFVDPYNQPTKHTFIYGFTDCFNRKFNLKRWCIETGLPWYSTSTPMLYLIHNNNEMEGKVERFHTNCHWFHKGWFVDWMKVLKKDYRKTQTNLFFGLRLADKIATNFNTGLQESSSHLKYW